MPPTEQAIKELKDQLGTVHEEFKQWAEKEKQERTTLGEAASETKAKVEKLDDGLTKITEQIAELEKKSARLDANVADGLKTGETATEKKAREAKAAYLKGMRYGPHTLSEQERETGVVVRGSDDLKALTIADDTTGGYLAAPPDMLAGIIKDITEISPMRSIARVRTTSRRSVQARVRKGTFAAQRVSETGTRSETTGLKYGLKECPLWEMYALVDISTQDLEDSEFNLEQELQLEFSEQFGKRDGTDFVSGSGQGEPEGFLTNADVGVVVSGDANLITALGLIDLQGEPKSMYRSRGTFVLNRKTLTAIRKLQDDNKQFLWMPGLASGEPNTLLGDPYVLFPDMPDIAANAYPVAYGDWREAYLVVDRRAITTLRDPLTQATSGLVRFLASMRDGGLVVKAEAIKKQKIAAS